ncbi:hypothetical protein HDK90DRAFT_535903 [Phyllosticta capitalensis]|uniref:Uncharacterized protein n=1 Tax=Phyllosticta capitalensis TaxID=121624 RepID=A0ABR1YH04_9PEZI
MAQSEFLVSPLDLYTDSSGEETSEESEKVTEDCDPSQDGKITEDRKGVADGGALPLNEVTPVLAKGDCLAVALDGSEIKLTIQYDAQQRVRIFGVGTGGLSPIMEFPGSWWNDSPIGFFSYLNETASRGSGLPFVNKQALRETAPWLINSKRFHVCGDEQAHILLKTLLPYGCDWTGPLTIRVSNWEADSQHDFQWIRMLANPEYSGSRYHNFSKLVIVWGETGLQIEEWAHNCQSLLCQLPREPNDKFSWSISFAPPLTKFEVKRVFGVIDASQGHVDEVEILAQKVDEVMGKWCKTNT